MVNLYGGKAITTKADIWVRWESFHDCYNSGAMLYPQNDIPHFVNKYPLPGVQFKVMCIDNILFLIYPGHGMPAL